MYKKRTKTNQPFTEFAYVFKKGALYPAEYEAFRKEVSNPERKRYRVMGDYFVQRITRKGKILSKFYSFSDGFVFQLSDWIKKGYRDIYILNTNEAFTADYYYKREIQKLWGDKQEPLIA